LIDPELEETLFRRRSEGIGELVDEAFPTETVELCGMGEKKAREVRPLYPLLYNHDLMDYSRC